ncbi:MAG: CoB--CoM heterodisulfide reductase iron-sulfur subunit A family protein [Verrucomicrobia bacterium]|nr:CoB--CoM heterodisulfide reductase iron-sulfur subunit A family protein [Verrucomicrobiota bacterium]MCF7708061.1 CoB--CoM heterodisulfide reductase iron-sulfur subunit A family protein [Verrucomicrobiota bacterium]
MKGNNHEPLRIGFYICHCGTNIASVVDVEKVAETVKTLPNVVVSRDYKYMCSDPGQDLIQKDIRDNKLNRVVVAACSPLLHEETFRKAIGRTNLNPYFFHMVNIREHNAWVHESREEATYKAIELSVGAIRRVSEHKSLERKKIDINQNVLILGGGIAGINAALTIADSGKKVYLVERDPSIGGHMAKFDKTFPTLDCAACILTPKMSAVKSHPNITLWTYSEMLDVDGFIGNYNVKIRRKPRYVNEELCTGCQECVDACVFKNPKFPDEFNLGLSKRKPIYLPFPQATPLVAVVDPENCLELKTGKCKKTCVEACGERNAIDFEQTEKIEEIEVGAILVATGFKTFDPARVPYYGYGVFPNVYTALEIERMINAAGPTNGEVLGRDGKKPRRIGIIHCVGSRDENTNRWCSRVCCLYSLKLAHLLKERTGADIYSFYIDMRTPGKSMEEFYNRIAEEGINLIRGRVADIYPENGENNGNGALVLQAEDTLISRVLKVPVDMVVLSTGLEPQTDAQEIRRKVNMSCSAEGFYLEKHPKLAPVSTFADGVFIAGCCQGPKDIPDTVSQSGAAAAEAMKLIDKGYVELEPNTAVVEEDFCSGCKSCIPLCPFNAISFEEERRKALINEALCKGCGTCTASCPSGSIRQNLFEDDQIFNEIDGILQDGLFERGLVTNGDNPYNIERNQSSERRCAESQSQ